MHDRDISEAGRQRRVERCDLSSKPNPRPLAMSLVAGAVVLATAPAAMALNVPTGANDPSPTFGAQPFTARVVLFEEFGLQNMQADATQKTLPRPIDPLTGQIDCTAHFDNTGLDTIIGNTGLFPMPGQFANEVQHNPWEADVKGCLPATAAMNMLADGRPWGQDFAHQRWTEFSPQKFFQSIQTNARTNGGPRDHLQLHGYAAGEFGPGGLYHNTVTSPYAAGGPLAATLASDPKAPPEVSATPFNPAFNGTTRGIPVQIHPMLAVQHPNSLWTFDGTIPPKLLMARYGETILFRHHNALPIDPGANNGFGTHTISTHEHNGHNPAESDGFAGAYFYPGQYYDYRWPMQLAGRDTINTAATDARAATPCSNTETAIGPYQCEGVAGARFARVPGDYRETMSTHWFHDHMLDYTAQNVYKGNAAMMNYYSRIDRGNEAINDGVNLRFPSGTAKEWGNRDYDVNLVVADKAFDQTGQLWFNPFNTDGFLGDQVLVNWVYKPYMDVRARRYRFRILNGSVSRYFKIAVAYQDAAGKIVQAPMHMIANDGNIMEHSVAFPNAAGGEGLPTQSIAERDDVIIDFAPLYAAGVRRVYLVNLMEHTTGAGPKNTPVTLAKAWNAFNGNATTGYNDKDLAIGKFMEFRLRPMVAGQTDPSMNPANYVAGKSVMLPLPTFTTAELNAAKHRTFRYVKSGAIGDTTPWQLSTDGGAGLTAQINRISAAPVKNSVEIWHLVNTSGSWSHPAHIHFEEGQIIKKNGVAPPAWEKYARKDMYRVGPELHSAAKIDVAVRIRDYTGTFVQHCHNTQHEDHAMLLRWDSENADHLTTVHTPFPDWNGPNYDTEGASYKLPTADTGSKTTTEASSFTLPANWGARAADVPASSAPTP